MPIATVLQDFPLILLVVGMFLGYLVQAVGSRIRHEDEWPALTLGYKVALASTGAFAALVAGTLVLDSSAPDDMYIWRMLRWQVLAGWAGSFLLDAASQALTALIARWRRGS